MQSCSFDESNHVLESPDNPNVSPLCAAVGADEDGVALIITCWKLTQEEVEVFSKTGRIWVVMAGVSTPPLYLTAIKPAFADNFGK